MRKTLSILVVLAFLLMMAVPVSARRCGNFRHRHGNTYHTHYSCIGDGHRHGRSFWQKHRDKLTTAAGVGAGALIGGVAGVRKARSLARRRVEAVRPSIPTESASVGDQLATRPRKSHSPRRAWYKEGAPLTFRWVLRRRKSIISEHLARCKNLFASDRQIK
jgi:hypothetical protein